MIDPRYEECIPVLHHFFTPITAMVSSYILFTRKLIILTTYPQNRARVPYYRDRNADCVRLYDFSEADDVRLAKGVLDICTSAYDEPQASNYNIGLMVPYDEI